MKRAMQITIPKPCHEDWNKMTPNEKGRHCNSCQKSVYDFTNKTDSFIIKIFEKEGNICGRFINSQLKRSLNSNETESRYLPYLASGLFAFLALGTNSAIAQGDTIKTHKTEIFTQNTVNKKEAQSILKTRIISGIAIDEDSLPLPGVNVLIKGTNNGTTTDFDGKFKLKINTNNILNITYPFAITQEIEITTQSYLKFNMVRDKTNCNQYITAGVAEYETPCEKAKRLKTRKEKRQKIRNGDIERTTLGKFLFKLTNVFR